MIHNYGVRVLVTITEQVNSSPGLRIPAAAGALAPVRSLKAFPPLLLGGGGATLPDESGGKDARRRFENQRGQTWREKPPFSAAIFINMTNDLIKDAARFKQRTPLHQPASTFGAAHVSSVCEI